MIKKFVRITQEVILKKQMERGRRVKHPVRSIMSHTLTHQDENTVKALQLGLRDLRPVSNAIDGHNR